jgi:hypothetical protein
MKHANAAKKSVKACDISAVALQHIRLNMLTEITA